MTNTIYLGYYTPRNVLESMSISNSIRLALNIKDPNITFDNDCVQELQIKGVLSLVYSAKLLPPSLNTCPHCGVVNQNFLIIKNGSKVSTIKMPPVSNHQRSFVLKNSAISANTAITPFGSNFIDRTSTLDIK